MVKPNESVVFVNTTKLKRAEVLYPIISGVRMPKTEDEAYNKERYIELAKDAKVDLKDKDAMIRFIYETMGGAVLSQQEVTKKKEAVKKAKKVARTIKDEEEGADDADDDEDEDDDTSDDDE